MVFSYLPLPSPEPGQVSSCPVYMHRGVPATQCACIGMYLPSRRKQRQVLCRQAARAVSRRTAAADNYASASPANRSMVLVVCLCRPSALHNRWMAAGQSSTTASHTACATVCATHTWQQPRCSCRTRSAASASRYVTCRMIIHLLYGSRTDCSSAWQCWCTVLFLPHAALHTASTGAACCTCRRQLRHCRVVSCSAANFTLWRSLMGPRGELPVHAACLLDMLLNNCST